MFECSLIRHFGHTLFVQIKKVALDGYSRRGCCIGCPLFLDVRKDGLTDAYEYVLTGFTPLFWRGVCRTVLDAT